MKNDSPLFKTSSNIFNEFKSKESIFKKEDGTSVEPQPSTFLEETQNSVTLGIVEEEHLEAKFNERSKLFRFNSETWTEMGIGDTVITEINGTKRVSFIREKIRILGLDFLLTYDVEPTLKKNAVHFMVCENGEVKLYAIKFGKEESANSFYNIIKK
ncbi:E3 SUMO-protein ligase RanBP2 [Astathelohania contejeani]|uniref:E3 SUMO-protein ligase RanBP2 n=1 Tax=Astathelohania contejeani TaxID=164912 RepID=A0ABQ7I0P3_9MICR|nr:E3 SUMO-protein ligase RanBP2 [Thelohania contejeani]